jgi:hypothetical protein
MASASALCTKALDPIDADHLNIVKPETDSSFSYMAFKVAFSDSTVQIRNQIDYATSNRIASEIAEIIRFPDAADTTRAPTVFENLIQDKKPQRIYRALERYNKRDIENVFGTGVGLFQFKTDYYDFQSRTMKWEESTRLRIGTMVQTQFQMAWNIYLTYAILRLTGRSTDDIKRMGNFLNYDITWEEAERIYNILKSDPAIAGEVNAIIRRANSLFETASKFSN